MTGRLITAITTGLKSGCVYLALAVLLSIPINYFIVAGCVIAGTVLAGFYTGV